MGRRPNERRNSYGAWLYHLRKERRLTQDQLARQCGIPQRTLSQWELTGNLTGRTAILRLAKALGVPLKKLLRPQDEKPIKGD
jgi:transcriptional regulator with XRE-family HTH domain